MAKKTQQTKILYTVMAVVLSLVIFPLLIVVWELVDTNRDAMRTSERFSQLQTVQDVGNQVGTYVNGHRDQIVGIARAMEASDGLTVLFKQTEEERVQRLSRFLNSDPTLIMFTVIPTVNLDNQAAPAPTQGALVLDRNRITYNEATQVVKETEPKIRQSQGRTYTSEPRLFSSSNEFAITIGEPLIVQNQVAGAVVAVVSMEPSFRFVTQTGKISSNAQLLKEGRRVVFLVNKKGRVIIHPDREMVYSKPDVSNWEIVKQWMDSKPNITAAAQFELTLAGEKLSMLGSYSTAHLAPGVDLGAIAVINENVAYSSVGRMITTAIKLSLVTVVLAAGVGTLLAFWVTSPIQALAHGARAISAGDFSKRIRVRTKSEIGQLAEDFNSMAEQIQRYITDLKFAANENRQLFLGTVRALAEAIDGKDPYTRGHSERVMQYSVLIAQYMGMNDAEVEDIRIAAILHDVGKIGIEDRILKKPAALTEEEYTVMKGHPQKGANIMSQIPQMKKYVPGMYYHHECMDGKGYPLGLKSDQIPMMARIISVADTFDAMTTNRPYQRAMEPDFAVSRIYTFSGTRYDPVVVKALDDSLKAGKLSEVIDGYKDTQK